MGIPFEFLSIMSKPSTFLDPAADPGSDPDGSMVGPHYDTHCPYEKKLSISSYACPGQYTEEQILGSEDIPYISPPTTLLCGSNRAWDVVPHLGADTPSVLGTTGNSVGSASSIQASSPYISSNSTAFLSDSQQQLHTKNGGTNFYESSSSLSEDLYHMYNPTIVDGSNDYVLPPDFDTEVVSAATSPPHQHHQHHQHLLQCQQQHSSSCFSAYGADVENDISVHSLDRGTESDLGVPFLSVSPPPFAASTSSSSSSSSSSPVPHSSYQKPIPSAARPSTSLSPPVQEYQQCWKTWEPTTVSPSSHPLDSLPELSFQNAPLVETPNYIKLASAPAARYTAIPSKFSLR